MNRKTGSVRRRAIVVCIGGAVAVGLLPSCAPEAPKFNAVDITGAEYARDFPLTDHLGQSRSIKDFSGKIVAVFFGFVQCPDVCPATMAELAEVKKLLGSDGQKLQVIFITVDPQRDSAEVMKAYMANFDPTFLALLPTPEQLAAIAKDFKVFYKRVDGSTAGRYTVDHSAGTYIFDTKGRIRLFSRYGSGAQTVADDIKALLKSS
jgi:protein SCO1/2